MGLSFEYTNINHFQIDFTNIIPNKKKLKLLAQLSNYSLTLKFNFYYLTHFK